MTKMRLLKFVCIFCIAGIANAQQQVSEIEARNAAINARYNKANVLNRSASTEIDTVSFSQNNDALQTVSNFKRHSIYAEFFGNSIFYSVNYDYLFRIYRDNIKLAVGAGAGYMAFTTFYGGGPEKKRYQNFYFTPEVNFLFGKKSHYLETGTALMMGIIDFKYLEFLPSGRIGYRYQPQKGGFLFRIAYTPSFVWGALGFCWFGFSFGYIF